MSEFWQITVEESMSEAGIEATPEQVSQVVKAVEFAHRYYGEQHGYHEADKAVKRMNEEEQRDKVFSFVRERMRCLEDANIYDRLNYAEMVALHELFNAKKFFR